VRKADGGEVWGGERKRKRRRREEGKGIQTEGKGRKGEEGVEQTRVLVAADDRGGGGRVRWKGVAWGNERGKRKKSGRSGGPAQ